MRASLTAIALYVVWPQLSHGQGNTVTDEDIQTVLDPSPFVSARAASLGGAMSTLADGLHAPYYNPAGIGGIHWGRTKPPGIRQLSFPYLGVAANEASSKLSSQFNKEDASTDRAVGKGIVEANAGKRQFFRASGLLSFGFGRVLMLHSSDTQLAAFKKTGQSSEEGSIAAAYQSLGMTGIGASATDPKERIYLGAFVSHLSRSYFQGDITYDQIVDREERGNLMNDKSARYEGVGTNLGMIWILNRTVRPALAVVVRHAGGTSMTRAAKPKDAAVEAPEKVKLEEDLTIGFSLSPRIGKRHHFNFVMEGTNLTNKDIAVNKKFRTGVELNFWGFGSEALVGLRAGYNLAGGSIGASVNLNLIQFEIASQAEDIGIDNRHVVERRNVAIFSVNVRDD